MNNNVRPLEKMVMFERLRRLAPLTLIVALIEVLGSIASIQSGWGNLGVVVSGVLSVVLLCLAFWTVWPVLVRTDRGVTLLSAIHSVGLTDIENREDETIRSLPPVAFYAGASNEVLITGVTGYRTFDQHIDTVRGLLDRGRHVYILILHPNSSAASSLSGQETKDIQAEILATLDVIRREKLVDKQAFHIRFMQHRPPYTAVMIDGDVAQTGVEPRDENGRVRVQPAACFKSQHKGIVLQFAKHPSPPGGFDYFATDLRREWKEAKEDENLLQPAAVYRDRE